MHAIWPNALLQHPAAMVVKDAKEGVHHSSLNIDSTMEPNMMNTVPAFRGLRVRCAINVQHPNDVYDTNSSAGGGGGAGILRKLKSLRSTSTGGATLTPEYHGEGVEMLKKVVEVGPGGMIVVTSEIAARILGEKENLNEAITKAVQSDAMDLGSGSGSGLASKTLPASRGSQLVSLGIHEMSGLDDSSSAPVVGRMITAPAHVSRRTV